jgi:hypothetical protein
MTRTLKAILAVALVALPCFAQAATVGLFNKGSTVMLNPQPLPPGPCRTCGATLVNPFSKVMLNPQPLPPRLGR